MLKFSNGDRVMFQPPGRETKVGMLTRYNRKTVTVVTDTGERWNVAPVYLRRAETVVNPGQENSNVFPPHRK